jgi:hypothetical protein
MTSRRAEAMVVALRERYTAFHDLIKRVRWQNAKIAFGVAANLRERQIRGISFRDNALDFHSCFLPIW